MEQVKVARVVPSGKVYRQMFDAEVQLVRALEKTGKNTIGSGDLVNEEQTKKPSTAGGIPIVKDQRADLGTGMLTERQKSWAHGFSNEPQVENPVLFKYYLDDVREQRTETEASSASQEVRGLPDVLTPAKTGSDIIERIAESRKQRHEAALEDMHQELGLVSSDLEPRIVEAGENLLSQLQENDKMIESIMSRIQDDQDLMAYTQDMLLALWREAASQSAERQEWILKLDDVLSNVEEERMSLVREVFQTYTKMLQKIAHLMAPDLQRLLDTESQLINQTVLSNRRAYADLHSRLMMSDIEREKKLHTQWKKRVEDWKTLHTDLACSKFREFMESGEIIDPPGARTVLNHMKIDQDSQNQRRVELVNSLMDLKPPASTKTAVYKWNQQITDISKDIDELNQQYFNKLYAEYEKVCQKCLGKVEDIRSDLITRGICTEQKAQEVINEQCLPLVGERQGSFEQSLEEMDKTLEEHNGHVLGQLKSLFKFCQGAAHVWDCHEIGLAKQERALQEKLEQCRHQHDNDNQDLEANLDILMDRMRQDSTEDGLKDSLQRSLDMLNKIKAGYETFHTQEKTIVEGYPDMVKKELQNYDASVCKFFAVDRNSPDPEADKKKKKKTSRPNSQASDNEAKSTSPLPQAVTEVLSTSKGTTFYILTVAGEHGIPPEAEKAKGQGQQEAKGESQEEGGSTFMTESGSTEERKPFYIESVDIPDDVILDVKKKIRLNFLDHLEDWSTIAVDRSGSVVAAKTEELNSELDLRMHLHQPRARRAELDVHNVRAAELVMHSERVMRHCKGVIQALTDLKQRFNKMTEDHNRLVDHFRADIEALEIVFINATKSSKLVSLSSQLQQKQERHMSEIRTSLRQFRQSLDDTLQMLRDSNARFIKSFKLFSDGGNFCPEEIEEYRKRLEKMSQKIDSSEGFIMADLEGMESKRLDQATKIALEFEDRFKHHMIDLLFMEKIARWLTNTQVKIKAEVADSNSQAQKLTTFLNDLERRIDACLRPNLDKEQVTPTQLNDSLKMIFESFHDRSHYLNCLKGSIIRPPSATMQGNPALGARVGFTSEVPPVSKPGKQPTEDPTVGVIKNILKTQKTRLSGMGIDGDLERELTKSNQTLSGGNAQVMPNENKERNKSRGSRPPTDQDSRSKKSSRHGTAPNSAIDTPKRAASGTRLVIIKNRSKGTRFDPKYMVFGMKDEQGEDIHLLGKVRKLLREALDGLLSAAEMYYRQKGNRPVTRPQALQEQFEQCADILVEKLQSYYKQADEYHNQCLQELRSQLVRLEDLIQEVPSCVVQEVLKDTIRKNRSEKKQLEDIFNSKSSGWDEAKHEHQNLLRPVLGHPQQIDKLAELCNKEETRRQKYLEGVNENTENLKALAVSHGEAFIDMLAKTSEMLFLQFDNLLTVDDVEKGRVPPPKHSTSELIRRKNAGVPLEDMDDKETMPRGKSTWPGIPKNELVLPEKQDDVELEKDTARSGGSASPTKEKRAQSSQRSKPAASVTASVTTAKTTKGHLSTREARDKAYQEYKAHFNQVLLAIEDQKQKQEVAEQRWTDSWISSVEKIKQLY